MKYLSILILSLLFVCSSCNTEKGNNQNVATSQESPKKQETQQVAQVEKASEKKPIQAPQSDGDFDLKQYFKNIKETDNCLAEGESFDALGRRLDATIKAPLNAVKNPTGLKDLFYKAVEFKANTPPPTNQRCADTNEAIKQRCIQKLGSMASPEAAATLIEIYKDKQLPFLGGEGRVLANAMIQCGSSILPLLKPIKEERPQVSVAVLQAVKE